MTNNPDYGNIVTGRAVCGTSGEQEGTAVRQRAVSGSTQPVSRKQLIKSKTIGEQVGITNRQGEMTGWRSMTSGRRGGRHNRRVR